jgi:hypothetical protein
MWCVIMTTYKKSGNWKIWIKVNFYINNLEVINRFNDMEYNYQSHPPPNSEPNPYYCTLQWWMLMETNI